MLLVSFRIRHFLHQYAITAILGWRRNGLWGGDGNGDNHDTNMIGKLQLQLPVLYHKMIWNIEIKI